METVPSWWWVHQEPSSPHRMQPHGLQGLLEKQVISMELPTHIVNSRLWVHQESSSTPRMQPYGLKENGDHQEIYSMESPTE